MIASETLERWRAKGSPAVLGALETHLAFALRGALDTRIYAGNVWKAKRHWIRDFRGDQFAIGRAFYTHYETDQSAVYFRQAEASDASVEAVFPGLRAFAYELARALTGGLVRPRYGFSGPGVHIFLPGGPVAKKGGVVHFDVEGLAPLQLARRARTFSLVVMLEGPDWGGGLRLFDALYDGQEHPSEAALASAHVTARYGAGDALFFSSYRLHQIRPFRGRGRVSMTLHGVEVDRDIWEAWF